MFKRLAVQGGEGRKLSHIHSAFPALALRDVGLRLAELRGDLILRHARLFPGLTEFRKEGMVPGRER